MQRYGNDQILYSPSDLVTFLGCHHASFLDVRALGEDVDKAEAGATARLLQQKGLGHEAAYLRRLRDAGKSVVEISKGRSPQERAERTLEAMQSGCDVIYQAVFFAPPWRGDADFLVKCDAPSRLGDFSYEVLDTKLARTAQPKHIMQISVYSELLAELQGRRPSEMHLFLGDHQKHSFRVNDFFYYCTRAKGRFESHLQNPPAESYPEPCGHCDLCPWREGCNDQWEKDDHLSLVANIQRPQMDKLRKAGIHTVAELAAAARDAKIPDLNRDSFSRLRSQAVLQHHKTTTGEDKCEVIPFPPGKGFARMPAPDDGDLFFDMEGDPLYPNGLEYLFGVYYFKSGGDGEKPFKLFEPFWAHNHEEEKETFKRFMGFLADRLAEHPQAHIYHYNHYETTALKRLACRYAACEEQLDNLLRNQKFIDLYLVVRESIRTSEPGYSIKNMETFYMDKRTDAVTNAADSIIVYNEWRETGADELLQELAEYNKVDCVSTHLLRDWLLTLKPKDAPYEGLPEPAEPAEDEEPQRKDWEVEYENYQTRLGVTEENPPPINERLSHLLEFHNRESKPQWWSSFERQNKFEDELIDDAECLGGLQLVGKPEPEQRSLVYSYRFPPQEHKLKAGTQPVHIATMKSAGTILEIDEDACIIKIKRGAKKDPLPESLSIGPPHPIDAKTIRATVYRYADHVLKTPDSPHAATELLARNVPRIQGKPAGEAVITSDDLQGDALEAIAALEHSYLFIQGPPGAGKTYTGSHIIVDLIKRGKKIGVTSNSHKAIHNLLEKVERVAKEKGVHFRGIKKAGNGNPETFFDGQFIRSETKTADMSLDADLFAGTAWAFAHPHFDDHRLDYLFIDEAGQVATANVVAMSNATKNIILVGDQMQLGQPIQGTHPGEAGLSVLEFLLGYDSTIESERGIFLDRTHRMRPSICRFISDAFYDGRLTAHESTAERNLNLQGVDLPNEGIVIIPAEHEGCSQKSAEEGEIIKAKYQALLGQEFTDRDGTRPITEEDIMVVTPYNVQVNHLRSILPDNARVGTVDKFQGQEAPIVLISMATSSAEDLPRNIEFLYSKNRLNVAISRGQCLAVVVFNPKLLETPCGNVEQMKLINTFCRLSEYAESRPFC